jgi:hypothetical protein
MVESCCTPLTLHDVGGPAVGKARWILLRFSADLLWESRDSQMGPKNRGCDSTDASATRKISCTTGINPWKTPDVDLWRAFQTGPTKACYKLEIRVLISFCGGLEHSGSGGNQWTGGW